jgi:hypothetical protein
MLAYRLKRTPHAAFRAAASLARLARSTRTAGDWRLSIASTLPQRWLTRHALIGHKMPTAPPFYRGRLLAVSHTEMLIIQISTDICHEYTRI